MHRRSIIILCGIGIAIVAGEATSSAHAASAPWKPDKAVEIVAQSGPGGGTDLTARLIQKILQDRRLVDVPVTVANKVGGGGNVGLAYLAQRQPDGLCLEVATALMLTNRIIGNSTFHYTDFTTIAQLNSEYVAFAVRSDSPLRNGRDLLERLKLDAALVSIAVGTSLGGANHIASAMAARAVGADARKLKTVVFKSSVESVVALLGGHLDLVVSSASLLAPQFRAGTLRVIAMSAPRRSEGIFAAVPTWKEQGHDIVSDNFRALIGPPGMSSAQLTFWDEVFSRLAQTDEWKKEMASNLWENNYLGSAEGRKYFETQFEISRRVLTELGLAK